MNIEQQINRRDILKFIVAVPVVAVTEACTSFTQDKECPDLRIDKLKEEIGKRRATGGKVIETESVGPFYTATIEQGGSSIKIQSGGEAPEIGTYLRTCGTVYERPIKEGEPATQIIIIDNRYYSR